MALLWLLSLWLRDASVVDRYWGVGFCVLFAIALSEARFLTFRAGLVLCLLLVWGLRLSVYIHFRNRGKPEDPRYQQMRQKYGSHFWWKSFFLVFLLQGMLQWMLCSPLVFICLFPQSDRFTAFDVLGVSLWVFGFLFEAISDFQMSQFKKNPTNRGKVCRVGLWSYSRHPNYFGETVLWWGYWVLCLNTTLGLWTIYSPMLMTFLLLRVSGVTLLESQLKNSKAGYEDYIREVPAFVPFWTGKK